VRRRLPTPTAVALAVAATLTPAAAAPAFAASGDPGAASGAGSAISTPRVPDVESLHYRWRLGGLVGSLAAIFLPDEGRGLMTIQPSADGELTTELLITSQDSKKGEFWRYGSEIDAGTGYALDAWSSYKWRNKERDRRDRVTEPRVYDMVAAIYAIRRRLPQSTEKLRVWSDGKIYPVEVLLRGVEKRQVGGVEVDTVHYTVQGDKAAEGRYWKGTIELWLARDGAATPVELHIERSLAALRLHLTDPPSS